MKEPLAKKVIGLSGDFGQGRTHDKLKQWIEANGGKVSTGKDMTHLLCSENNWKKQNPTVKAAMKQNSVKIVSFDWLEDSLMNKSPKREGAYLCSKIFKSKAKAENVKPKNATKPSDFLLPPENQAKYKQQKRSSSKKTPEKAPVKDLPKDPVIDPLRSTHHLFRDYAGNVYSIGPPLWVYTGKQIRNNKLRIWESNATPHTYAATNTIFRSSEPAPGNPPWTTHTLADVGTTLAGAIMAWKRCYTFLTGDGWDFEAWAPMGLESPLVVEDQACEAVYDGEIVGAGARAGRGRKVVLEDDDEEDEEDEE